MFGADPRSHAKPASDPSARDRWPAPGSVPFGLVGSVIPPAFAAHRAVLHPATRFDGDRRESVSWAEVASRVGREIRHPDDWRDPDGELTGAVAQVPEEGTLPAEVAEPLIEVLLEATSTPARWWIGVWEGYGSIRGGGALVRLHRRSPIARWRARRTVDRWELDRDSYARWAKHAPLVDDWSTGSRHFLLFEGGPEAVLAFAARGEGPNLWWPDDGAWCVATDIDLPWTYVGADETTIGTIEERTWLELDVVRADDPIARR